MDFVLKCNYIKCRTQLNDRAVVTTCSHIFCPTCADDLGLSRVPGHARICPACEATLTNPDDVVDTKLNPTEDYKTSVLSGLSPGIIMECCGRGLAFYSYQANQEIVYQEYLEKKLMERYSLMSSQMDQIIHDANSEITNLRKKLSVQQIEFNNMFRKNTETANALNDKSIAHARVQKMYDDLKTQLLHAKLRPKVIETSEYTLQSQRIQEKHKENYDPSRTRRLAAASRMNPSNGSIASSFYPNMTPLLALTHELANTIVSTPEIRSRLPLHTPHNTRNSTGSDGLGTWSYENRSHTRQTSRKTLQPFNSDSRDNSRVQMFGTSTVVKPGQTGDQFRHNC